MRWALVLLVLAVGASGVLIATETGRAWLRVIRAEVKHRVFVAGLEVEHRANQMLPMADGVRLATDLYLPKTRPAPTVLIRLPYGKTRFGDVRHWLGQLVPEGYAVVVQDMRGRHRSEGVFAPWPNEASDGAATLDWIVAQEWSDGQVGTIGCSALGESQVVLGRWNHPAHKAMVPLGAGGAVGTAHGLYQFFGIFDGGVPALATGFGWFVGAGGKTPDQMSAPSVDYPAGLATLPLREAVARFRADPTDFEAHLDGFDDPAFHQSWGYLAEGETLRTPALFGDTWFDPNANATLAMVRGMREAGQDARAIIAPGLHCDLGGAFRAGGVGDVTVDPSKARDLDALFLAHLNHHLKGAPRPALAPYTVYLLGADRWIEAESWPPENAAQRDFYLDLNRLTETAPPAGTLAFTSDPTNPVPSVGGAICCTGDPDQRAGPLDQSPIEGRDDLLVFTSPPLDTPLEIAGPITGRLFVSTDVPDTDLVMRVTDLAPNGRSVMIQEGALRLRYREGFDQPQLMEPGRIYPVEIQIRDIAWRVPKGHSLRVHVAGSSFPRLARNMNTGGRPQDEASPRLARITLHLGAETPSMLRLYALQAAD